LKDYLGGINLTYITQAFTYITQTFGINQNRLAKEMQLLNKEQNPADAGQDVKVCDASKAS
jgi:hypothetical protein